MDGRAGLASWARAPVLRGGMWMYGRLGREATAMGETVQHGQRSFLGVFDRLLKAMQMDYARCERFEASGYADFAGQLYTLNSNMFQNRAFCDRMLTQMILHYLTWYQDPGLQLVVGPGAAWRVTSDFSTQRYGDSLYVTQAAPCAAVRKGEQIVGVNGKSLAEVRPEVERTLWTTVEPADPEREDWSIVLAFAKNLQVRGADGSERTVKVDVSAGDAEWAKPMRRTKGEGGARPAVGGAGGAATDVATHGEDAGRAELAEAADGVAAGNAELGSVATTDAGVASGVAGEVDLAIAMGAGVDAADEAADGVASSGSGQPCCELGHVGDVVVLTLRNPGDPAFGEVLGGLLSEVCVAKRLVIDVRGCRGGTQEDIFPLVPFVLAPGTMATPEQLFGRPGIAMNYSRHNVDDKLKELEVLRVQAQQGASAPEDLAELDDLAADLWAKRGQKGVREMEGAEAFCPDVQFSRSADDPAIPARVVVLADRCTGEAAEWLVRAVKSAGYATVMGRATIGSLDNTCPRAVRLDDDLTLILPTATYLEALEGDPTLGRGITPDVHIPWTPAQLSHDVELETACERVAG